MDQQDFPTAPQTSASLEEDILDAIKTIRDPEIPVDLVALGLIYALDIRDDGVVSIDMTLTSPACPVAGSLPGQVQQVVAMVPGVAAVIVTLVWSPPWTRDRMSEEATLELGLL
jgi:FeS assembly SUF system protein